MHKPTILDTLLPFCSSGSGRISTRRFSCLRFLLCCLWLCAGLLLAGSPVQAETKAGDILVIDQAGGTTMKGALFLVNPQTGQRTVLSDFGNPAQGSLGAGGLSGVAVGAAGRIFVTDLFAGEPRSAGGALFEVDPDTGNRTLLSNFSQGDIQGRPYYGLAVDIKGRVIANLTIGGRPAAVVRVDPDTDERTVVTDLTNPRQGETDSDRFITDLALERSGKILISTHFGLLDFSAAIFRVQPQTGKRKLLSDFTNAEQGVLAVFFTGIGMAVETSGQILANAVGITEEADLILRIAPKTGQRTVLSNLNDAAQEPLGQSPAGLAVERSGAIVVGAYKNPATTDTMSLFRVNSKTGRRALLSDSDNPGQDPSFSAAITYIAVVPSCRRHTSDSHGQTGDEHHPDRHACRE